MLLPQKSAYLLEEARHNVQLRLRVYNIGDQPLIFAYPNYCLPKKLIEGVGATPNPQDGSITVSVTNPEALTRVFRNNHSSLFEPQFASYFNLAPDASVELRISRLGPEFSLSAWEGITDFIFTAKGEYQVLVKYKNQNSVCYTLGKNNGSPTTVEGWTGELISNKAVITIK